MMVLLVALVLLLLTVLALLVVIIVALLVVIIVVIVDEDASRNRDWLILGPVWTGTKTSRPPNRSRGSRTGAALPKPPA